MQIYLSQFAHNTAVWWGPVLAGFIGALGVHLLTRSREREFWIRDCEKEEWRELVTAMTKAEVLLVEVGSAFKNKTITNEQLDVFNKAAIDAYRTILDRIFIADVIARTQLMERWSEMENKFLEDDDADAAGAQFGDIKGEIISLAVQKKRPFRRHLTFLKIRQET